MERAVEEVDESGRLEAERIRKMRGRMSTFLTRGVDLGDQAGATKLGA